MSAPEDLERFERLVMPHLDAGYNLARWLTRSESDAEDVVQTATLRAFRAFARYRGGDPRAWMLTIVRNASYTWLRQNRSGEVGGARVDAEAPGHELAADPASEPEVQFLRQADRQLLGAALEALPAEFREVLVLRELEDLSYKEIAEIVDVPLGTVMSRLARARQQLQRLLLRQMKGEA